MTVRSEPVTLWFDHRLVMRASPIHGIGTFAAQPIRAGERLIQVTGGIYYSTADWKNGLVQIDPEQYNESQLDDDLFVATPKSLYYYINHSCSPNMLNDVAWKDIGSGEEVTTDYAYCEASPGLLLEQCKCGTELCRGRMTGNDWKLLELQERYQGYFTPFIEKLIRASKQER